ncbi:MAG: D-aminoacyl-tRNA deacylase, partial [Clostridia bacterium]
MKTVIQRVTHCKLVVLGQLISEIGNGLVVFFGVEKGDVKSSADYLADKISKMRIFADEQGKMNLSVIDKGYEIMAVSQFTLCADCKAGNRPSFIGAELPEDANAMYEYFVGRLTACGV